MPLTNNEVITLSVLLLTNSMIFRGPMYMKIKYKEYLYYFTTECVIEIFGLA